VLGNLRADFVVYKVTSRPVSLQLLILPPARIIPALLHTYFCVNLVITERKEGEVMFFRKSGTIREGKCLH
jgi:hypothetical protein